MTRAQIERRNALVVEHLPMVDRIAGSAARRLPPWIHLDDLKSAGQLGLLQAATSYDAAKDPSDADRQPFVAWAVIRIRYAILDAVQAAYKGRGIQQLPDELPDAVVSDHGLGAAAMEAACERSQQTARIHLVVSNELPRRERRVVELHYRKGHNMQIVARKMKTSPTKVFQLRAAALSVVRERLAA